ncbi:phage integrase family protein [Orientia chuto str. Dubai]|uniref:Phage integrase family protein n=1 Tax=Orientia chuto str. Dubai TaxID=1359168 RepID=A0A0F3MLM1_9RICK|nr:site-specific integrase [Candidatus Orientia mediorientalis]KJV55509.1 phage integrase family protein [Orientia chuto str. Dubai]
MEKNPTQGIERNKEQSRERYITKEEMVRFRQVLNEEKNELIKDFILILLYTGVRKTNVLEMEWKDISIAEEVWNIPKTKNGKPQNVALTKEVIEILKKRKLESKSKWVLQSDTSKSGHLEHPYRAWYKICQKASMENLRIHDLRRTFATWMVDEGVSPYVMRVVLNHGSIHSTSIYARANLGLVRQYMSKVTQMMNECTGSSVL